MGLRAVEDGSVREDEREFSVEVEGRERNLQNYPLVPFFRLSRFSLSGRAR